jgi:hypothetical protein
MAVDFNHTIVWAQDSQASLPYWADPAKTHQVGLLRANSLHRNAIFSPAELQLAGGYTARCFSLRADTLATEGQPSGGALA